MSGNIFDSLNYNFFNIFSSDNKKDNAEIIVALSKYIKESIDSFVLKEDLISYLIEIVENRELNKSDIEDSNKSSREYVLTKLSKLKKYEWIEEEPYNDYQSIISLKEAAIPIIDAFESILKKDTVEYTGYLMTINSLLVENFKKNESYSRIEQAHESISILNNKLRGINSKIKKYLSSLLTNNNLTAREILNILLIDYQDTIIDKAFKNLKTSDNISKFKSSILNKIDDLSSDDYLYDIIDNYKETKKDNKTDYEIKEIIINKLNYIYDRLYYLDSLISSIDSKNSKYINTATSRFKFLVNETYDIYGLIEDILRGINKVIDEESIESVFDLSKTNNIDEESLYKPRIKQNKNKTISLIEDITTDSLYINQIHENIFKETKFTKKRVDKYVKELLNKSDIIDSEDIEINDIEDIGLLMLIEIYSSYEDMCYFTTESNKIIRNKFVTYKGFIINKR